MSSYIISVVPIRHILERPKLPYRDAV